MKLSKYEDIIKYVELEDSARWTISYVDITRAPYIYIFTVDKDSIYEILDIPAIHLSKPFYNIFSFEDSAPIFNPKSVQQDTINQSDSSYSIFNAIRSYQDTIGQSDLPIYNVNSVQKDTIGQSDSSYSIFNAIRSYQDTIGQSDSSYSIFNAIRSYQDTVGQSDLPIYNVNSVQKDTIGQSDLPIYNVNSVQKDTIGQSDLQYKTANLRLIPNYKQDYTEDSYFQWTSNLSTIGSPEYVYNATDIVPFNSYFHQDYSTLNFNKAPQDSFEQSDSISYISNFIKPLEDSFEQSESLSLKFDSIRSYSDEGQISDTVRNSFRLSIYDPAYQDYVDNTYFDWKVSGQTNYNSIYNNTPGIPYSYSTQESVKLYLNGSLIP